MKAEKPKRSPCPIAATLDIVGDKWTLLVIRDLFLGRRTYNELMASPEAMPSNILADRLKRLEKYKIIRKKPYQQRPVRYAYMLTKKGQSLKPLLRAMVAWGLEQIPGTRAALGEL